MPIDQAAVDAAVESALTAPKIRTINGRTVVERDIDDLLKARDAAVNSDTTNPSLFHSVTKLISPGAG